MKLFIIVIICLLPISCSKSQDINRNSKIDPNQAEWLKLCSAFPANQYFSDIVVIDSVTKQPMTASKISDLLYHLPNVANVIVPQETRRPYSIERLAYPQDYGDFELTQKEWITLQAYCREELKVSGGIAVKEVVDHWKSIVAGTPPFGLRIQP